MAAVSWKGYLRLSLVSAPVVAVPAAASGGGEVHLHQLHAECKSRIRYKKICPIHGEVPGDEIVMAYEYEKGQYVIIDQAERSGLRTSSEKTITIEKLVPLTAIDPLYFSGRSIYLLPDGAGGEKPYAVLCRAMEAEGRCAIAQASIAGRDQMTLIRPADGLLVVSYLYFASQLKPVASMRDQEPDVKVSADELRLARMLIQQIASDDADLTQYQDTYTEKFSELIAAKVEGREIVAPPEDEEPRVVNLMDALRKSLKAPAARAARKPSPKQAHAGKKAHTARAKEVLRKARRA